MATIVLLDIDGTLITTAGASRQALIDAFVARFDRGDVFDGYSFGGGTDRGLIRYGLQQVLDTVGEPDIDAMLDVYVPVLARTLETAPVHRLHPGVMALVDALDGRDGLAVGLGTGNIERGARLKIEKFGLNPRLPFGGFGCDAEDRGELIAAGFARGAARLGRPVDACRKVVVGDTPRDVWAARANGARCVAVSTGGASVEALRAAEPDTLFDDLTAPGVIEAILG